MTQPELTQYLMWKEHFNRMINRKIILSIGLLGMALAIMLSLYFRVPIPLTLVPALSQNAVGGKSGTSSLNRDERVQKYGPKVPSIPEFDELGEGKLTEAQQREFFKFHTGIEVPASARNWSGEYKHHEIKRYKELNGRHLTSFTLPKEEALVLFDEIKQKWAARFPAKEEGSPFGFGPQHGATRLYPNDLTVLDALSCGIYPYIGKYDTISITFSPSTGYFCMVRTWGEA